MSRKLGIMFQFRQNSVYQASLQCDFEIVVPPLFIKKTEIIRVNFERWCSSIADFGIIIVTSGLVASTELEKTWVASLLNPVHVVNLLHVARIWMRMQHF